MYSLADMRIEYWSDDTGVWYADGSKLDRDSNRQREQAEIPVTTQVIAVRCRNTGDAYGVAAWLANGVVTDESWKCTNNEPNGTWTQVDYDDTAWPQAVRQSRSIGGLFSNGELYSVIWADCDGRDDEACKVVYCRKLFNSISGLSNQSTP